MKNEKHDSAKPVQIAIPSKDAIAIEPPKKVCLCFSLPAPSLILSSFFLLQSVAD